MEPKQSLGFSTILWKTTDYVLHKFVEQTDNVEVLRLFRKTPKNLGFVRFTENLVKTKITPRSTEKWSEELVIRYASRTFWSRCSKTNIVDNPFALENVDYVGFDIVANGNETTDFGFHKIVEPKQSRKNKGRLSLGFFDKVINNRLPDTGKPHFCGA